jgi:uncharacterized membrane protein
MANKSLGEVGRFFLLAISNAGNMPLDLYKKPNNPYYSISQFHRYSDAFFHIGFG